MFSMYTNTNKTSYAPAPAIQVEAQRSGWEKPASPAARDVLRPSQAGLIQRKCACGGSPGPTGECAECRARRLGSLKVSQPGDAYEQEADRVADQVMRMPETGVSAFAGPAGFQVVQRRCASCEDEIQRQEEDDETTGQDAAEEAAAAEAAGTEDITEEDQPEEDDIVPDETGMPKRESGTAAPPDAGRVPVQIPRESGGAMEPGIRGFMEERFGSDFGGVRIHTSGAAAQSARQLHALAYTVRQDVYFKEGQYSPDSTEGRRLLAHELAHVIQQTSPGQAPSGIQRQEARPGRRPSRRGQAGRGGGRPARSNVCAAGSCPQGKQSKAVTGDCKTSEPADKSDYISNLDVDMSAQTVDVTWTGGGKSRTETWPCSPNPGVTPKHSAAHPDTVGVKCGINHTNTHKDGMAWFTGFNSEYLRIGFHDSQPVGPGYVSHGCVRVCCDKAQIINKNTWSGKTKITVK